MFTKVCKSKPDLEWTRRVNTGDLGKCPAGLCLLLSAIGERDPEFSVGWRSRRSPVLRSY